MEPLYNVIFHGEMLHGYTAEQAKGKKKKIFKITDENVENWFAGNRIILKKMSINLEQTDFNKLLK